MKHLSRYIIPGIFETYGTIYSMEDASMDENFWEDFRSLLDRNNLSLDVQSWSWTIDDGVMDMELDPSCWRYVENGIEYEGTYYVTWSDDGDFMNMWFSGQNEEEYDSIHKEWT